MSRDAPPPTDPRGLVPPVEAVSTIRCACCEPPHVVITRGYDHGCQTLIDHVQYRRKFPYGIER
jgi:hypothetical protein